MTRNSFVAVLTAALFATGCAPVCECEWPEQDCSEQDIEEIEDTGDTDLEDTGTYDTGDTDVEDTGDTEPEDCTHEFKSGTVAVVTLENDFQVSLSSSSPSGTMAPGHIETLRFNFAAVDQDCDDLTLQSVYVVCGFTDNADTGWRPVDFAMRDLSTGTDLKVQEAAGTVNAQQFWLKDEVLVEAGSTHTFAVYADTTGASSSEDDSIQCFVNPESYTVSDSQETHVIYGPTVIGGTIIF